jgi:hypothetical protein
VAGLGWIWGRGQVLEKALIASCLIVFNPHSSQDNTRRVDDFDAFFKGLIWFDWA